MPPFVPLLPPEVLSCLFKELQGPLHRRNLPAGSAPLLRTLPPSRACGQALASAAKGIIWWQVRPGSSSALTMALNQGVSKAMAVWPVLLCTCLAVHPSLLPTCCISAARPGGPDRCRLLFHLLHRASASLTCPTSCCFASGAPVRAWVAACWAPAVLSITSSAWHS